jgi:thiamine-phosphate diphosphorylase
LISQSRPLLCLVTDRRRMGLSDAAEAFTPLVTLAGAAARAGVELIQLREKDLPARLLAALARRLVAEVAGTGARVLVNDRLDVALAAGAHGVHLREDSLPVAAVRRASPPGFLVGRSVHAPEAGRSAAAAGADYLVAGTVFASRSKPADEPLLGTDGLRAIVVEAGATPVLAIGGVDEAYARAVASTGAAGLAAIGWFVGLPVADMHDRVRRMRDLFDSAKRGYLP